MFFAKTGYFRHVSCTKDGHQNHCLKSPLVGWHQNGDPDSVKKTADFGKKIVSRSASNPTTEDISGFQQSQESLTFSWRAKPSVEIFLLKQNTVAAQNEILTCFSSVHRPTSFKQLSFFISRLAFIEKAPQFTFYFIQPRRMHSTDHLLVLCPIYL